MDKIISSLAEQGIIGLVLAFLGFLVWKLQSRLFTVVENNTQVMTELKGTVSELAKAQKRRREDFGQ